MTDARQRRNHLLLLLAIFLPVAIWAAISPRDRATWALENGLVLVLVPILALTYKRLPLSRVSYTLITLFLCFHEIGSHYVYAHVPYHEWFESLFGLSLGSDRNHYDRFVHFAYGLLLAYPMREVVLRVADVKGFWGYFLPLDVTMSTSMIYELIEWGATLVFGEGTDMAYLGTQGDVWDAQKDMLLATAGALIAMLVTAFINWRYQNDFGREWVNSLKVSHPLPAGEDALARMTRKPKPKPKRKRKKTAES